MFHERSMFSNFKSIPPKTKWINGIGNSRVEILGTGDITLNMSVNGANNFIIFPNSIFATKLGTNLISVGTITAEEKYISSALESA